MVTLISLIAALSLAAIPITLGWRRTVDEAGMARAMGIAQPKKKFDPEKFARQTGIGLAFNQIAYGFLAWVGGGLAGGMFLGLFPAICSGWQVDCYMQVRFPINARSSA